MPEARLGGFGGSFTNPAELVCSVECDIKDKVATASCSTGSVTIPSLPSNITKPQLPTLKDVTTETVDGTGVFDVYMRAGMNQLNTQYDKGRIKGSDFAQAYIQTMQLMMTEANKFVLGLAQVQIAIAMFDQQYLGAGYDAAVKEASVKKMKAEGDLLCQQIAELKANGKVERELKMAQKQAQIKQANLYDRQIISFKEKTSLDSSKILMDAWAVQAAEGISDPWQLTSMKTETKDDGGFGVVEDLMTTARKII